MEHNKKLMIVNGFRLYATLYSLSICIHLQCNVIEVVILMFLAIGILIMAVQPFKPSLGHLNFFNDLFILFVFTPYT